MTSDLVVLPSNLYIVPVIVVQPKVVEAEHLLAVSALVRVL